MKVVKPKDAKVGEEMEGVTIMWFINTVLK